MAIYPNNSTFLKGTRTSDLLLYCSSGYLFELNCKYYQIKYFEESTRSLERLSGVFICRFLFYSDRKCFWIHYGRSPPPI